MPTSTTPGSRVATASAKQLAVSDRCFCNLADVLITDERAMVKKVRDYMETKVRPIISQSPIC